MLRGNSSSILLGSDFENYTFYTPSTNTVGDVDEMWMGCGWDVDKMWMRCG